MRSCVHLTGLYFHHWHTWHTGHSSLEVIAYFKIPFFLVHVFVPPLPRDYLRLLNAFSVHCPVMWCLGQLIADVLSLDSSLIFLILSVSVHASEVSCKKKNLSKISAFWKLFLTHQLLYYVPSKINIWVELNNISSEVSARMLTVKSASAFLLVSESVFLYVDTCMSLYLYVWIKHAGHPFFFTSGSLTTIQKAERN